MWRMGHSAMDGRVDGSDETGPAHTSAHSFVGGPFTTRPTTPTTTGIYGLSLVSWREPKAEGIAELLDPEGIAEPRHGRHRSLTRH